MGAPLPRLITNLPNECCPERQVMQPDRSDDAGRRSSASPQSQAPPIPQAQGTF